MQSRGSWGKIFIWWWFILPVYDTLRLLKSLVSGELRKHCARALSGGKAIMAETASGSPEIHFLGTLVDAFAIRCGHVTEL